MERTVIYTQAARQHVIDFVRTLPSMITGRFPDPIGVGEGFRSRLAHQFYSLVAPNFDVLGRGAVGANNESWPRNSPRYLAYGKGPKSSRMGTGHSPNTRLRDVATGGPLGLPPQGTGHLTEKQLDEWWYIYLQRRNLLISAGVEFKTAQRMGAVHAWNQMKRWGARTLLQSHGDRRDQVLVDRGILRSTMQPGYLLELIGPDAQYRPPHRMQVFETEMGKVVCGTNHPHAAKHHLGKGHLPVRRLWPRRIPSPWWSSLFTASIQSIRRIGSYFP